MAETDSITWRSGDLTMNFTVQEGTPKSVLVTSQTIRVIDATDKNKTHPLSLTIGFHNQCGAAELGESDVDEAFRSLRGLAEDERLVVGSGQTLRLVTPDELVCNTIQL